MENRINIGELDTLVTLFSPVAGIGTQGEKTFTYKAFRDVFAKIDGNNDEVINYSNLESEQNKVLTVYKVPEMTTRWRVQISGQMYEISSIDPISRVSPLCLLTIHSID